MNFIFQVLPFVHSIACLALTPAPRIVSEIPELQLLESRVNEEWKKRQGITSGLAAAILKATRPMSAMGYFVSVCAEEQLMRASRDMAMLEMLHKEIQEQFPVREEAIQDEKEIFITTNDNYYAFCLKELESRKLANPRSAALLVGPSALVSSLPDLPEDLIFVCDIQHGTLIFMQYLLQKLGKMKFEESLEIKKVATQYNTLFPPYSHFSEFIPGFQSDIPIPEAKIRAEHQLPGRFEEDEFSLGDRHFIYRPTDCQKAMARKKVIFLRIDLFNLEEMSRFAQILKLYQIEISYFNMSNLDSWDEKKQLLQTMPLLPAAKETFVHSSQVCASSTLFGRMDDYLTSVKLRDYHLDSDAYTQFLQKQPFHWSSAKIPLEKLTSFNKPILRTRSIAKELEESGF